MSIDFHTATQKLNTLLKQKEPQIFSPLWIKYHDRNIYTYLRDNIRTETGAIDWDSVTVTLDRTFQKRWQWQGTKNTKPYEDKEELHKVQTKYQNKLYTLLTPIDGEDKKVQDQIIISFVRIAQNGNTPAQQQIIEWCNFIIQEWIEDSAWIAKLKGYPDDIEKKIIGCIRCYRYTGTFMGYLFRTLQYAGRGLRPTFSLNTRVGKGNKTRLDYILQEEET